ncbi:MAG: HAD family hydrolase [Candidatus Curtissbacteria bacterium GW2011_GWA1_41_11]|uniref:HAD family hydrolase n=1 Tax=Candidatus Curtissbacteria bacterium GW2011_GWA1_41_11 TaxID=1618409 RepID=A0A0G0UH05_9BACT|nr:MAG: HAD family hydrolase [Candidatus Curtissbacteria bacterium GW2011_GWA1_41_11]
MDEAVIFDMDGLMLDTKLTWRQAEIELLKDLGKEYDIKIAKRYQGMRVSGVVEVMIREYHLPINQEDGEKLLTDKLVQSYDNPALELLPGCERLVKDLSNSNQFKLAIASSSPKVVIETMTRHFNLSQLFDLLVSGEEVKNGKPAPDVYLKTSDELGIESRNCVVLEDAPNGATAGKKANMKVIAVVNKVFFKPEEFEGIANLIVESLEDLDPTKIASFLE